jgi:tripeptide aminopeptidase
MTPRLDDERAIQHLMDLLPIPGLSGRERPVADFLRRRFLDFGCDPAWIREDDAHTRIPGGFEMGNLIIRFPGTRPGPTLMFSGHMDTVPLTRGAKPVRKDGRIVPEGPTALGADNRTACAAMLSLAEVLLRDKIPHPPITFLFSVGEEIGLWGAREVNPADLGHPALGFNIDSGEPDKLVIGAIGAHRWEARVTGVAAHAGVHPERGVSAILVASRAIAAIAGQGYFGKIDLAGRKGTSNVGLIQGGEATNQVTDTLLVKGESRSHDPAFLGEITQQIESAFHAAAASVVNDSGRTGKVDFVRQQDYQAFCLQENSPVIVRVRAALETLGLAPRLEITNGGLDANYLNAKGIPTVTLGAGQHNPHTPEEYADLAEFTTGCRLLLRLATLD